MDYNLLTMWQKAAEELARAKALEMTLRKKIFTDAFSNAPEGASIVELQDGWKLKATVPYTYALDQTAAPDVLSKLKKLKATNLMRVKYETSVSAFKALPEDSAARSLIVPILTIKPGTAAMELIPPPAV